MKPENKWASGYKGQIVYAFMPEKIQVKNFNWKVKWKNGKEENFHFESQYNYEFNYYYWVRGEKSSESFEVDTNVYSDAKYIYSYFDVIKETTASSSFDLEFSLDDFLTIKKCSINNITFSGKNVYAKSFLKQKY